MLLFICEEIDTSNESFYWKKIQIDLIFSLIGMRNYFWRIILF